jgi:LacI family transcriptional regulator
MTSIKDVANKAGVSTSTVSKVLKNYPNISADTAGKVMKAVRDLGYVPNTAASTLSSKRINRTAIYVYINDKFQQIDEINMLYLLGAFDEAQREGMALVTVFSDTLRSYPKEAYPSYFSSLNVDSLIIFGLNKDNENILSLMQDEHFKFVVVDAGFHNEHTSCVWVDQRRGQYEVADAVTHPKDKVLYISGKSDGYVTDLRLAGMHELARDKDLDLTIRDGEFSEKRAYQIVSEDPDGYDAVVCASDLMAIGARRALAGRNVPVSGFDGIRLMGYAAEDVITCRQNFYGIGRTAVQAVSDMKNGALGREIIVPYEIGRIRYRDSVK